MSLQWGYSWHTALTRTGLWKSRHQMAHDIIKCKPMTSPLSLSADKCPSCVVMSGSYSLTSLVRWKRCFYCSRALVNSWQETSPSAKTLVLSSAKCLWSARTSSLELCSRASHIFTQVQEASWGHRQLIEGHSFFGTLFISLTFFLHIYFFLKAQHTQHTVCLCCLGEKRTLGKQYIIHFFRGVYFFYSMELRRLRVACISCAFACLRFSRQRRVAGFTWVSKEKGCSLPRAGKSSVLSVSDSWSPPPSAHPRSLWSPHSAGPPVRITSRVEIFHVTFLSKSASKLGTSSAHAIFMSQLCCGSFFIPIKCYIHHPHFGG